MMPDKVVLTVTVDLDAVPGPFHSAELATKIMRQMLNQYIPHYNPVVHFQYQTRTCPQCERDQDIATFTDFEGGTTPTCWNCRTKCPDCGSHAGQDATRERKYCGTCVPY